MIVENTSGVQLLEDPSSKYEVSEVAPAAGAQQKGFSLQGVDLKLMLVCELPHKSFMIHTAWANIGGGGGGVHLGNRFVSFVARTHRMPSEIHARNRVWRLSLFRFAVGGRPFSIV
jgi:hypothetical protein